jgi:exosortase/archaeosortase family protein
MSREELRRLGPAPAAAEQVSLGHAAGFVLRAVAWVALFFGLLRAPWVQKYLILPFAGLQQTVGCAMMGAPRDAIVVDQSCTGSDAMALAIGAILAFPASWRSRLKGAALGLVIISAFNTVRIGTLAAVVDQRQLFLFLHLTAWPAVLIVIAAGYVFAWMQWVNRRDTSEGGWRRALASMGGSSRRLMRFVGLTILFVTLYYVASRWFMTSDWLLRVAHWATAFGGAVMRLFGVASQIEGNIISTEYGRWRVSQECVATPLVAVYLAAVLSVSMSSARRAMAVLAALPLFILLGSARLLVLALPTAAVGSHLVAIHAFYQVVAAAGVVYFLGPKGDRARAAVIALVAGTLAGVAFGWVTSSWVEGMLAPLGSRVLKFDPQGALSILPGYQIGLWVALVMVLASEDRWRRLLQGVSVLALFQVALIGILRWVAIEGGLYLPVIAIRMVALLVPLALAAWWLREEFLGSEDSSERQYKRFWADVGANFPDLRQATSTALYREDEQRLFSDYLAPLDGQRIFKTDLWDEVKNTRILRWAAGEGVRAYGIDISPPIASQAKEGFVRHSLTLAGAVSDVRAIPFRDDSFDGIYSMGTVEHFDETDHALSEIFRVLRPGGTAVIGVPNRHDPFLRPLFVAVLYRLGLYGYGFEKSYSRKRFRSMLGAVGFEVVDETGILFIPGWLRMAELALHSWARPLTVLTWPFVKLCHVLSRRFPGLRRHGYLLATVLRKPETSV